MKEYRLMSKPAMFLLIVGITLMIALFLMAIGGMPDDHIDLVWPLH